MPDLFNIERDNARTHKAMKDDAATWAKMEKHFQSHPELKAGRDFRMEVFHCRDEDDEFREKFDQTFAGAPSSPDWWDRKFCEKCGRRKSMCICIKG